VAFVAAFEVVGVGAFVFVPPAVGVAVVPAVDPHAATTSPAAAVRRSDRRSIVIDDTG
jgi:hypothetical protein